MFFVRESVLKGRGQHGRLGTAVRCQKRLLRKTSEDKNSGSRLNGSLNSKPSKPPEKTPPRDGRHPEPYEAWRSPGQPKSPPKPPEVVAMEEFAALERKLAANAAGSSATSLRHQGVDVVSKHSSRRKTEEQVEIEEGGVLESKRGDGGRTEASGLGKASSSSLQKPEKPQAEECCGNGCQNCVWIGYWEDLQKWEEAERRSEREEAPPP